MDQQSEEPRQVGAFRRVLVVGLDAGDAELVDRFVRSGAMPVLGELRRRGCTVALQSVARCFGGAVWPTVVSGQLPGEHDVADHFRLIPGTYRVRGALAEDGRLVAGHVGATPEVTGLLFDVPKWKLEGRGDDTVVVGWGAHAARGASGCRPKEVQQLLEDATSGTPVHDGMQESDRQDASYFSDLERSLESALRARAFVVRRLLQERPWDVAHVVLGETHPAGHRFFDAANAETTPALERIYRCADEALGRILDEVGRDTAVIVTSGHGIHSARHGRNHLLPWLARRDGVSLERATAPGLGLRNLAPVRLRDHLRRILPASFRHRVRARLLAESFGAAHWPYLKAFPTPSEDNGYLRVKLRGREPQGIVEPGAEYRTLLDELTADLLEWRCADTDARIVRAVHRPHELFPGPHADRLPDLVAEWTGAGPVGAAIRTPAGTIEASSALDHRGGEHRPLAFATIAGARHADSSTPGDRAHEPQLAATTEMGDLIDIVPTALALIGRHAPARLRGRSLVDVERLAAPDPNPREAGVSTGAGG